MIEQRFLSRQQILTAVMTLCGAGLVLLLIEPTLAWQMRLVAVGAAVLLALFVTVREINLRLHLYLCLLTFAFGWRTRNNGGGVVDAQQVVAWLLLFHVLMYCALLSTEQRIRGAWLLLMMLMVTMIGILTAWANRLNTINIFNEVGPLLLSAPVIVCLRTLVRDEREYRYVVRVIMIAVLFVAIPGIVGYMLKTPGSAYYRPDQGFWRANFPLWGGSVASYGLAPLILLAVPYAFIGRVRSLCRMLAISALGLGLVAVYISGQRGAWIAVAAGLVAFAIVGRKWRGPIVVALVLTVLLMPSNLRNSLFEATEVDSQAAATTSSSERHQRAAAALTMIAENPLIGRGISAAGWAHTDILQLGANLGIPAALLVLFSWYGPVIFVARPANRSAARSPAQQYEANLIRASIVGAAVTSLILLATQAMIVISALALPIYIVSGLLWARYDLRHNEQ